MAYDILREKFINNIELLRDKYANEVYTIKKNGKGRINWNRYWKEENIHYHFKALYLWGIDSLLPLTTINLLLKDLDNFTDGVNIVGAQFNKMGRRYDWKDLKQQLEEEFETLNTQTNFGEEEKIMLLIKMYD